MVGTRRLELLLTESKFKTFTPKHFCDARKFTEVLVCLSSASRDEVNEMVRKVVAAGGTTYKEPQENGFMYDHGIPGSGWTHLGVGLHGSRRQPSPRKVQS